MHYGAAKAALIKLTIDLARQLGRKGIRVNAVAPGNTAQRDLDAATRAMPTYPLGQASVPVEAIVHAVQFLADSTLSPMTTGQHIAVDGGIMLERADLYDSRTL